MPRQYLYTILIITALHALGLSACSASAQSTGEPLTASGFIEADSVSVVSEVGGRVSELLADESDSVEPGQAVVQLDTTLLEAERARAQAAVETATASLNRLMAGASPEETAAAEAALNEARAQLEGARLISGQAWGAASDPTAYDARIASAETEADLALKQVELLRVQLEQQHYTLNWLESVTDVPVTFWVNEHDDAAIERQQYSIQIYEAQLRAAEAQYQGALRKLDILRQEQDRPLVELATAQQAAAQIPVYEAQIDLAQARYNMVANGATIYEQAIARAQLQLAEANLAIVDAKLLKYTLAAPIGGVVTTRSITVGETAQAGVPLLTIANLDTLRLVVYIPETQIGQVMLGAPVEIAVDAYSGRTFEGKVVLIGREAEFTPRNVQTEEERVNLVFAVEIQIDNPDGLLRPGMPADVNISPAQ